MLSKRPLPMLLNYVVSFVKGVWVQVWVNQFRCLPEHLNHLKSSIHCKWIQLIYVVVLWNFCFSWKVIPWNMYTYSLIYLRGWLIIIKLLEKALVKFPWHEEYLKTFTSICLYKTIRVQLFNGIYIKKWGKSSWFQHLHTGQPLQSSPSGKF